VPIIIVGKSPKFNGENQPDNWLIIRIISKKTNKGKAIIIAPKGMKASARLNKIMGKTNGSTNKFANKLATEIS
jgi:hypothetical protein